MQIKFLDLGAEYHNLKPQIDSLVSEVLTSSEFIGGKYVQEFEKNFAHFTQTKGCVGVGNGTDALEIAIKALNLPTGSEIILPANTFFASIEAVLNTHHKAILVDCQEDYLLDPQTLQNAITPNTAAIMPVHLYGRACNMDLIIDVAKKHSLKVIEDCSQAHGAKTLFKGEMKNVGSIGDIGCFSFYPGKNLGAYGDGGAIISNDLELLEICRSLANHGIKNNDKHNHCVIGRNSRLDALQAGILNIKLKYLYNNNLKRQKCAKIYAQNLSKFQNILLPPMPAYEESNVWHLYVIRLIKKWTGKRQFIMEYLEKNGVASSIHYPQDLGSLQVILSHPQCTIVANKNAQKYATDILSLPIGPHIKEEHIHYICEKFGELENILT